MKKPRVRNSKTIEVTKILKAFELKWKCDKGHTNFIIALEEPKTTDCCLKCGQVYDVNFL